MKRRTFLSSSAAGAAAVHLGGCASSTGTKLFSAGAKTRVIPQTSTVAIAHSNDRREATYQSLLPFKDDIARDIIAKKVVVKVNCGVPVESCRKNSTYPDQVRGILDLIRPLYDGEIIISEGSASEPLSVFDGYELYGLLAIEDEYPNVRFIDANDTSYTQKFIRSAQNEPIPINILDIYLDPDVYLISTARMKTHNAVVATLSAKNVLMGSPVSHYRQKNLDTFIRNEKTKMHGGQQFWHNSGRELSYNLVRVALSGVQPDLAVIDGVTAIEGNGPWGGEVVEHGVSVASTDFVAADRICIDLMGIDPMYMKYVEWCGNAGMGNFDRDRIRTVGASVEDHIITYRLHEALEEQIAWIRELYDI